MARVLSAAGEQAMLREWHRLFGLLLTDFFTNSPFTVEIERDLSAQQQFLDIVIVRRRLGVMREPPPDGLEDLRAHNLITFKSHHETLDAWAIKELIGHYVAYRKMVSSKPTDLISEEQFRLYAVCARFPQNLSSQVAWREWLAGVYDCQWGTDSVRVVVAGQLPRVEHNAPLLLFSASPELVGFGSGAYRPHSEYSSTLLHQLFDKFRAEGSTMAYTMQDFIRDYVKTNLARLTPNERCEVLESLTSEERLAGLSDAEIRRVLELRSTRAATASKKRKKK